MGSSSHCLRPAEWFLRRRKRDCCSTPRNLLNLINQYDYISSTAHYFIVRSTDHGKTWSQAKLIATVDDIGITDVKTGEFVRGGADHLLADPRTGTLYVVWQDAGFSGDQRDGIAFSKSTDHGVTWSAPVQVNQAPNVQAFAPSIAINKNDRIAIAYYDFRNDNSDPNVLLTNYWRITSDDGGKTWHEIPLSSSFDLRRAPRSSGYMITDYEGLVPAGDSFISFFVRTNWGGLNNRTDVFAVSTETQGDTTSNHLTVPGGVSEPNSCRNNGTGFESKVASSLPGTSTYRYSCRSSCPVTKVAVSKRTTATCFIGDLPFRRTFYSLGDSWR